MPPMTADRHEAGHESDAPGHADAVAHHRTDDHGDDHGHDDHAHGSEALGPIDAYAWGAGILGIIFAIVIALTFALSTSLG
jgi:hypothetical protein